MSKTLKDGAKLYCTPEYAEWYKRTAHQANHFDLSKPVTIQSVPEWIGSEWLVWVEQYTTSTGGYVPVHFLRPKDTSKNPT